MIASNFSVVASIFGFVATAISLLAIVAKACRSRLPSSKIKDLEELLDETEHFFRKAVEEGLLTEPGFVQQTELDIRRLKTRMYGLRARVYKATGLSQDYAEFFKGTSTAIDSACQSLKKLKAQVITSSEEGRLKLMEIKPVLSNPSPPTLPYTPDHRPYLGCLFAGQISRPHSCPPALSTLKAFDVPTDSISLGDSTQSGSDVQTIDVQTCTSIVCTSVTLEPGV